MPFIKDDLTVETLSEPMGPDDLLVAIIVSAQKNGSVSFDEVAATCEAAGRKDLLTMAKELGLVDADADVDPALEDPEPDEDDPTE